jgi:SAM-dependent methyltransferase
MKSYTEIQGWCDFEWLYKEMATKYRYAGTLCEVGCWKGRSLLYLAEQLKQYDITQYDPKPSTIFAIDTWAGSDESEHQRYIESVGGPDGLYQEFLNNVKDHQQYIIPLRGQSVEVAKLFPDHYFDFVFIDASHKYEDFKADVLAWLPKVKKNGDFYGHDSDWPPIQQALNEIWPGRWEKKGSCWKGVIE